MFGEAPLADALVGELLLDAWGIAVERIAYETVGYGSYHWRASGAEGREYFVTADPAGGVAEAAYLVARRLADGGLGFVRAPYRCRGGGVVRKTEGWLLSVWPWHDGRTGSFSQERTPADLAATVECLRRLHSVRSIAPVEGLVESWTITGRTELLELVESDDWGSGPYVDELRGRLAVNAARVREMFASYDQLVANVGHVEFVITHGEPHPGNVIHTTVGPMLIDWDTVRWAPRERDLWALPSGWRDTYGDGLISEGALEVYRLQWALSEIADFALSLASATQGNPDLEIAMGELRTYLPD